MKKYLLMAVAAIMAISASAQETVKKVRLYKGNTVVAEQNYDEIDSIVFVEIELPIVVPDGVISGKFTINSDGDQIMFSQGNLQYQASTNTWRFAENQYDTIGLGNSNISDTYIDWIDLFGWGTGNNPTNSSTDYNDYSTFVDWGVNAISNGGNGINLWRTLTGDEWGYIFHLRANAGSLFGFGCVNDVNGLIILPDEWILPENMTFNASMSLGLLEQGDNFVNSDKNNYSHNSYTSEQWLIMEQYGAVFLPAAGDRNGTNIEIVGAGGYGDGGHYWSATPYDAEYSYDLNFNNKNFKPNFYHGVRTLGESVRLVKDVE